MIQLLFYMMRIILMMKFIVVMVFMFDELFQPQRPILPKRPLLPPTIHFTPTTHFTPIPILPQRPISLYRLTLFFSQSHYPFSSTLSSFLFKSLYKMVSRRARSYVAMNPCLTYQIKAKMTLILIHSVYKLLFNYSSHQYHYSYQIHSIRVKNGLIYKLF